MGTQPASEIGSGHCSERSAPDQFGWTQPGGNRRVRIDPRAQALPSMRLSISSTFNRGDEYAAG